VPSAAPDYERTRVPCLWAALTKNKTKVPFPVRTDTFTVSKRTGVFHLVGTVKTLLVYIVDDDESVRTGLSRLMRSAGFEARVFESAEQFLENLQIDRPGCVLLDITMPRVTGLEVQARLKQKGIKLPVIAVSARDDEETRRLARELGVQFFLRKPVDDQALLDAIAWVTGEHKAIPN
jgi:FixJ family two-component response regulator